MPIQFPKFFSESWKFILKNVKERKKKFIFFILFQKVMKLELLNYVIFRNAVSSVEYIEKKKDKYIVNVGTFCHSSVVGALLKSMAKFL